MGKAAAGLVCNWGLGVWSGKKAGMRHRNQQRECGLQYTRGRARGALSACMSVVGLIPEGKNNVTINREGGMVAGASSSLQPLPSNGNRPQLTTLSLSHQIRPSQQEKEGSQEGSFPSPAWDSQSE